MTFQCYLVVILNISLFQLPNCHPPKHSITKMAYCQELPAELFCFKSNLLKSSELLFNELDWRNTIFNNVFMESKCFIGFFLRPKLRTNTIKLITTINKVMFYKTSLLKISNGKVQGWQNYAFF